MQDRKTRTSRPRILLILLLCVVLGGFFTQSSANPKPMGSDHVPEVLVAEKPEEPTVVPTQAKTEPTENAEKTEPFVTNTPAPTPTEELIKETEPTEKPKETVNGVWVPSGSNWMYLTDGVPYTGWLTDADGNRYFFDKEGLMHRGWLEDGGKRYYFNLDGVMQIGKVTIENETYEFLEDGSQKNYKAKEPAQKKDTDKKKSSAKKSEKNKKDIKKEKKYIALTFDDGPSSFTGRLLDCLEENNAKATFFMVGTEIVSFPDEVQRMAKLGMELGNHTYDHLNLTKLTLSQIQSEIGDVDQTLFDLTAQGASVVRPPYGSINDNVKASVGTPMILWSIDTLDWKTQDVQNTVDTVMNEVKDGSIILMHDIYKESVDAAEILIPKLIEEGYELVTVHELAAKKGIDLKPGIAYGEMK